jgi:hypothetical protein
MVASAYDDRKQTQTTSCDPSAQHDAAGIVPKDDSIYSNITALIGRGLACIDRSGLLRIPHRDNLELNCADHSDNRHEHNDDHDHGRIG